MAASGKSTIYGKVDGHGGYLYTLGLASCRNHFYFAASRGDGVLKVCLSGSIITQTVMLARRAWKHDDPRHSLPCGTDWTPELARSPRAVLCYAGLDWTAQGGGEVEQNSGAMSIVRRRASSLQHVYTCAWRSKSHQFATPR
jgi:hypothetical protein